MNETKASEYIRRSRFNLFVWGVLLALDALPLGTAKFSLSSLADLVVSFSSDEEGGGGLATFFGGSFGAPAAN